MKRIELESFEVIELSEHEIINIEGGKVPLWLYFVAPGTAYLVEKFEKGCECNVLN
ncbi:hypothetical protein QF042_001193 [Pedobacter sp. W3I1]|uniref:hypothetical protein n=1 Tax=Pedobacter sp. W3I1 TaxID=3042291 RepID=UPI002784093A|nr:hypothetical protein [Pedobacter sp. W3I1]MDQ0637628.1 hypothetical protein [Pedobacter sp. W3I1]